MCELLTAVCYELLTDVCVVIYLLLCMNYLLLRVCVEESEPGLPERGPGRDCRRVESRPRPIRTSHTQDRAPGTTESKNRPTLYCTVHFKHQGIS